MYTTVCGTCGKTFERLYEKRERNICYDCALDEICGKYAPEEGDFNSAMIISGEMTEEQERWFQEDLEAVESGRSIREVYEEETDEERYIEYLSWKYGDN